MPVGISVVGVVTASVSAWLISNVELAPASRRSASGGPPIAASSCGGVIRGPGGPVPASSAVWDAGRVARLGSNPGVWGQGGPHGSTRTLAPPVGVSQTTSRRAEAVESQDSGSHPISC